MMPYSCSVNKQNLKIVNDYLEALDKMTHPEILAALKKAEEDSCDCELLDGEEDTQ